MRMVEQQLDLARSMDFDKEQFLSDMVAYMRTTPEEFARLYILEEYPMEVAMVDTDTELSFKVRQEFKIRRKTQEEMREDISRHITQGEN